MFQTIKETFIDLLAFAKNPKEQQDKNQTTSHKVKRLFSVLAIDLPITAVLGLLIVGIEEIGLVDTDNHMMNDLFESTPVLVTLLLTIILVPFIEELVFRLFLKWKRNYLLLLIVSIFPRSRESLYNFWKTNYGYVFYFSVITFGFVHITNYESDTIPLWVMPILVLPQLFGGVLIGYLRVRYNFMYGFFVHALSNAIFIIIALVSMESLSDNEINITNEDFSLTIEKTVDKRNSLIRYNAKDTIQFEAVDLKTILATIKKIDANLIDANDMDAINQKLNLTLINTSGRKINKDSLLLNQFKGIYNFSIENQKRKQLVFQLYVKDSLKLNQYLSEEKEKKTTSTVITRKEIDFENLTLQQMAKTLGEHFDFFMEADTVLSQKFSITLEKEEFPKLKNQLSEDFGIGINKIEKNKEYLMVSFK